MLLKGVTTMPNEVKPCPVCGGSLDYDVLGRPMQSVCRKCEERLLEEHKADELDNCPFCGADRTQLKHHIALPYLYGAEGVLVICKQCGARSGWGAIREPMNILNHSKPRQFNEKTIQNGFKLANDKWNRRSDNAGFIAKEKGAV